MNDCQSKMNKVAYSVSDLYRMLREDRLIPNARKRQRISSTPCQKVVKLYRWNSWLPGCYQILKLRNKLMRFLPTARARSITFNADESLTVPKAEQVENTVDALWTSNVICKLSQFANCAKVRAGLPGEGILNYMLVELTVKHKNRDAAPNINGY